MNLGDKQHPYLAEYQLAKDVILTGISGESPKAQAIFQNVVQITSQLVQEQGDVGELKSRIIERVHGEELDAATVKHLESNIHLYLLGRRVGFKAANLHLSRNLVTQVKGCNVPPYCDNDHSWVEEVLNAQLKKSYHEHWQEIIDAQEGQTKLTPKARELLIALQHDIQNAFKGDIQASKELKAFVNQFKGDRLIVRSTAGDEDTSTKDRAGEFLSVPNVKPELPAVLEAMGQVIASYLNPDAIEDRILGGEDISTPPILPVIVQQMIGNKDDPSRFVSGTLFLEEPLLMTPEQAAIQGAPGGGEFVVNSEGAVDSWQISESGIIHPLIAEKQWRRAPKDEGGTELRRNDSEIAKKPSLEEKHIRRLYEMAKVLREDKRGPVDIEWVIDKTRDVVYLVQCRPIVSQPTDVKPTYVRSPLKPGIARGETVIPADCTARECSGSSSCITAMTLDEAFNKYRDLTTEKKALIQAVLVNKPSIASSHAATQFRRRKIPIVQLRDRKVFGETQKRLQSGHSMVVDSQTGLIFPGSLSEMEISEGLCTHPLPAIRTLGKTEISEQHIREMIKKIDSKQAVLPEKGELGRLLEILKSSKEETERHNAVERLIEILVVWGIEPIRKAGKLGTEGMQRVAAVARELLICVKEASNAADQFEPYSAQRLMPIRMLEAMIWQRSDRAYRDLESIRSILTDALHAKNAQIPECISPADQDFWLEYIKAEKMCLSPKTAKAWKELIENILKEGTAKQKNQLAQMVLGLQKADLLSSWLNTIFKKEVELRPLDRFVQLEEGFRKIQPILNKVESIASELNRLETTLAGFEDPTQFDAMMKNSFARLMLCIRTLSRLAGREAEKLDLSDGDRALLRMYALEQLNRAIDQVDKSIKSVTGTEEGKFASAEQLVERFQSMVNSFLAALGNLSLEAPQAVNQSMLDQYPFHDKTGGSLRDRITWLQRCLEKITGMPRDVRQLEGRPMFDVRKLALPPYSSPENDIDLPSRSDLPLIYDPENEPNTTEELFTTIHNHCVQLIDQWGQATCSLAKVHLDDVTAALPTYPTFVRYLKRGMESGGKLKPELGENVRLVGSSLYQEGYIPLCFHSATVSLKTDITTREVTLKFNLNAGAEFNFRGYDRLRYLTYYMLAGISSAGLEFVEEPVRGYERELTMAVKIPLTGDEEKDKKMADKVGHLLDLFSYVTMPEKYEKNSVYKKIGEPFLSISQISKHLEPIFTHEEIKRGWEDLEANFTQKYPELNSELAGMAEQNGNLNLCVSLHEQTILASLSGQNGQAEASVEKLVMLLKNPKIEGLVKETLLRLMTSPSMLTFQPSLAEFIAQKLIQNGKGAAVIDGVNNWLQNIPNHSQAIAPGLSLVICSLQNQFSDEGLVIATRFLNSSILSQFDPVSSLDIERCFDIRSSIHRELVTTFGNEIKDLKCPTNNARKNRALQVLKVAAILLPELGELEKGSQVRTLETLYQEIKKIQAVLPDNHPVMKNAKKTYGQIFKEIVPKIIPLLTVEEFCSLRSISKSPWLKFNMVELADPQLLGQALVELARLKLKKGFPDQEFFLSLIEREDVMQTLNPQETEIVLRGFFLFIQENVDYRHKSLHLYPRFALPIWQL